MTVTASGITTIRCHCEERSDAAISYVMSKSGSSGRGSLRRYAACNDSGGQDFDNRDLMT